jgi:hypothetical protein
MKIEITEYKNFTIYYDENADKFVCDIEFNDVIKNAKRGSLKDIKNDIDQFIKANLNFKPFWMVYKNHSGFVVTYISAIRKDGSFVASDKYRSSYNLYLSIKDIKEPYLFSEVKKLELERIQKIYEEENVAARNKFNEAKEFLFKDLEPLDLSIYSMD